MKSALLLTSLTVAFSPASLNTLQPHNMLLIADTEVPVNRCMILERGIINET